MLLVLETLPKNLKYVVINPDDDLRRDSIPEWFDDPRVEDIVLTIDKTRHIKGNVFESPVLGTITFDQLSGGAKSTIFLKTSKK